MSLVSEYKALVKRIRDAKTKHEIKPQWIYDAFEALFNLDVWFKKVPINHPNARKILLANGDTEFYPIIKGSFQDGAFFEEGTQDEIQENRNKYFYYEINEKRFYFYKDGVYKKLGLPNNAGLIDTEDETGNVYTKEQIDALHNVEQSQETTVHFRKDTDYGTINQPLSTFTLDLSEAKRNVIQCIYFNGQELPNGINWLNNSDAVFSANTTFLIVAKWENNTRVIANLMTL